MSLRCAALAAGQRVRREVAEHLRREHVVIGSLGTCPCCGGKLRETITETLEVIPRRWKVIQTVREKFTCQPCEAITQHPGRPAQSQQSYWGRTCWR